MKRKETLLLLDTFSLKTEATVYRAYSSKQRKFRLEENISVDSKLKYYIAKPIRNLFKIDVTLFYFYLYL